MKASVLVASAIVLAAAAANAQDSTQENQPGGIPPLTQKVPYDPLKQPRWDERSSTAPPSSFYDPPTAQDQSLPPVRYFSPSAPAPGSNDND